MQADEILISRRAEQVPSVFTPDDMLHELTVQPCLAANSFPRGIRLEGARLAAMRLSPRLMSSVVSCSAKSISLPTKMAD